MAGTPTMTDIRSTFRTPLRILVPKLLNSRDDWKAKSDRRKAELRAARGTIRDLTASRDAWRRRAKQAQAEAAEIAQLREQLQRVEHDRDAAIARAEAAEKK